MRRSNGLGGPRTMATWAGVMLALVAGSLTAPAHAAPAPEPPAVECPTAVPMSSVASGMVGTGWTVVTGTEPQPFRVEVLGVLENGIGAGRDLIMIKVSDLPDRAVVSQGSGIWEGMSGSPVYVNGRLLGAVSYGFTLAPSAIGAVMPAASMLDVLNLGGGGAARAATKASTKPAGKVRLTAARRAALAEEAGTAVPSGSLSPLRVPLGVAGLASPRVGLLQDQLQRAGRSVHAYSAGAAGSAAGAPAARPAAGGNFAAVLSRGDVAFFGAGTTTAVCGDRAVAFGHPFLLAGPTSYGAAGGDSLAIVQDNTFGSFKMMNLGAGFGTVDQDRAAAVRADLGRTPAATALTTHTRNADTGEKRKGVTDIYAEQFLPEIAANAAFAGQDAVFDESNDGTATSTWKISGTRAGGRPLVVKRSNRWASLEDATIEPAFDLADATDQLLNNDFEHVTIKSISFRSTVATTYNQLHITKLEVSVNGGRYTAPKRLKLKVGAKLRVRVSTAPYRSTRATTTTFALTVPKSARGKTGSLLAVGGVDLAQEGGGDDECFMFGDCEDSGSGSLDQVVKSITSTPRNDRLQAQLVVEDEEGDVTPVATKATRKTLTVTGSRSLDVTIRR